MTRGENREMVDHLFKRLIAEHGERVGMSIIRTIILEVGGLRLTIPDIKQLEREERDRKIREKFTGFNCKELGYIYGLSAMQVRRIVMKGAKERD